MVVSCELNIIKNKLTIENCVLMSDLSELIKKRVMDQLYWDNRVDASDIEIDVDGTTVKLKGKVPSYSAREHAVLDAYSVLDVTKVENQLEVEYPTIIEIPTDGEIRSRIENQLLWNAYIDSTDLDVRVDSGRVELEGTTDAYWKKIRAKQLAQDVTGVTEIENKLAVVPTDKITDKVIAESIVSSLERRFIVDEKKVTITVENGEATLSGTVPHWSAYRAAINAAEFTAGVKRINDQILISK